MTSLRHLLAGVACLATMALAAAQPTLVPPLEVKTLRSPAAPDHHLPLVVGGAPQVAQRIQ